MPYKNIEDERNRCRRHYIKHREQILQRQKKYRKENREKTSPYNKEYYIKNREKYLEYFKQWYINNRDKKLQYSKQYNKDNSQHRHEASKKYYKEHSKEFIVKAKIWNDDNPIKTKEISARHSYKRRRSLGFNPLNKYFEGAEGHHINKNNVIYIPKEIHRSIWHCLGTGLNMEEMNKLAINFLNKGGELNVST